MFADFEQSSYKQKLFATINLLSSYVSRLLPHKQCFLCHQCSHTLICEICLNDTYIDLLPAPGHNLLENAELVEKLLPPLYYNLVVLSEYKGIIKALVNQLKFSGQLLAADVLAQLFEKYLGGRLMLDQNIPDAIIPVPLSSHRHISRQYNQARLLSQHLSAQFDIPLEDAVVRTRNTEQQSRLDREGRINNIKDAFKLIKPIEYESIAIVDDVLTTGATVNEVCKSILEYNPNIEISVWSMAISLNE